MTTQRKAAPPPILSHGADAPTAEDWARVESTREGVPQTPSVDKPALIRRIAAGIGDLTAEKNTAYGDSFYVSGQILALLYPNGVQPEQYGDMLALARIIDKLGRIATRKDAFGESPFRDIAGYGLIGVVSDELAKGATP